MEGHRTVCITGAGLSVASGVRPFRGADGVWSSTIYTHATRTSFRKNPLDWYNNFWLPHFVTSQQQRPQPNEGHEALEALMELCPSLSIITQNIDGLHSSKQVMEAHGRLGFFKCIPDSDSDTDSDSDEDDDRLVHLGHRRKSRELRRAYYEHHNTNDSETVLSKGYAKGNNRSRQERSSPRRTSTTRVPCRYELVDSIPLHQVEPPSVIPALLGKTPLTTPPTCPACHKPCPPQALLFDEGYHSHDMYQFETCEQLLEHAEMLMFVGTSFSGVRITQVALEHARHEHLKVYNFNTTHVLAPTSMLNVQNVVGPAQETLQRLLEACRELQKERRNGGVMTRARRRRRGT